MPMKIYQAKHFKERLKTRAHNIWEVMDIFQQEIKLVKKKKLRVIKQNRDWEISHELRYQSCTFIYTKKKGKYFLITFYQRWNSKNGMEN